MTQSAAAKVTLFAAVALALSLAPGAASSAETERFVDDNILVSRQDPSIAIAVNNEFRFVGRHPITIRDVGAGERFIFVDANDRGTDRLFIVQFEGFLPGVNDFFRYDLSKSPLVAGYPFRSNGYAFDMSESLASNPGGEAAATYEFLRSSGYAVPRQWMMWRSLTVADEARRKEMILFYVEDVESTGLALSDLYADDSSTEVWKDLQNDLEARANAAFRLAGLDESGRPLASGWSSIPNQLTD